MDPERGFSCFTEHNCERNACSPDVHVALSFAIVDRGKSQLPEDDSAVGSGGAADLDKVGTNAERDEVLIGDAFSARPHARLMLEPVVTRLEDFGLDGVLDDLEGLEGLLGGRMRCVQVDLLSIGCADITPSVV